jgi:L-ascorbate metabolism protein UlaG (beta-lactamase superfamily)
LFAYLATAQPARARVARAATAAGGYGLHVEVAGTRICHQGSAELIEDEIRDRGVDRFLCGRPGRRFTPRYIEPIVRALQPAQIIPAHYDDVFLPLEAPRARVERQPHPGSPQDVHHASRSASIATLEVDARSERDTSWQHRPPRGEDAGRS